VLGSLSNVVGYQSIKVLQETEFVDVTIQACGIRELGNTTIKLTRQQYENFSRYLETFNARLNQTKMREEALPLFREAVVELNKYGLLPKGMNIQQTQKLVSGGNLKIPHQMIGRHSITSGEDILNLFCFVYTKCHEAVNEGLLYAIAFSILLKHFYIGYFLCLLTQLNPFLFCNIVSLFPDNLITIGLFGIKRVQNSGWSQFLFFFTGLKIITELKFDDVEVEGAIYLGWAPMVGVITYPNNNVRV